MKFLTDHAECDMAILTLKQPPTSVDGTDVGPCLVISNFCMKITHHLKIVIAIGIKHIHE